MAETDQQSRVLREVRQDCPGALDDAIRFAFFRATDEFLRKSRIWKECIEFDVSVDEKDYYLQTENSGALVLSIERVANPDDFPVSGWMAEPPYLHLRLFPNQAETYTADVTLTSTDPLDSNDWPRFPRWIWQRDVHVLIDGTSGILQSQPAKPFSSERLAIYNLRRFRDGTSQATHDGARRNIDGGQRWRFPRGFA